MNTFLNIKTNAYGEMFGSPYHGVCINSHVAGFQVDFMIEADTCKQGDPYDESNGDNLMTPLFDTGFPWMASFELKNVDPNLALMLLHMAEVRCIPVLFCFVLFRPVSSLGVFCALYILCIVYVHCVCGVCIVYVVHCMRCIVCVVCALCMRCIVCGVCIVCL